MLLTWKGAKDRLLVGLTIMISSLAIASAGEIERDRCTCKFAHRGAESTLKGGTCVRTESTGCLMEWGGGSSTTVGQGNGWSQTEASARASAELTRDSGITLDIPRVGPTPDGAPLLQIALATLSRVPPNEYEKPGIAESFVLAAVSALIRFAKGPLNFLANNLLMKQREQFIDLLAKGGKLEVEQFSIQGSTGCLQIDDRSQNVHVFVKTPFSTSERC